MGGDGHLSALFGGSGSRRETYCMPKHDLCPVPNAARYFVRFTPFAAASIHRSGLKASGEGKILGSMQTKWTDWLMGV
jgi:hypothetical protein